MKLKHIKNQNYYYLLIDFITITHGKKTLKYVLRNKKFRNVLKIKNHLAQVNFKTTRFVTSIDKVFVLNILLNYFIISSRQKYQVYSVQRKCVES